MDPGLVHFLMLNPKYFLFYPSHRIFRRMYGALNVGKKDNELHSLSVNVGTNLLSLVSL
jgi:hypothetical protein